MTGLDVLTIAEVAEHLRVSKMTVYRMIHAGDIPALKIGRGFRIERQALADYLAAARTDGGS